MKLNHTIEEYAKVSAEYISQQDVATRVLMLRRMLEDIQRLGAEVDRLRGLQAGTEMLAFGVGYSIVDGDGTRTAIPASEVLISTLDHDFEKFKAIYVKAGGFRNPKSVDAHAGWAKAKTTFTRLIKKEKVPLAEIMSGVQAFVDSKPQAIHVDAPQAWLNKGKFRWDWAQSGKKNVPSQDDVESFFESRMQDR